MDIKGPYLRARMENWNQDLPETGPAPSADVSASSDDVSASSADIVASNDLRAIADVAAPNADESTSSADVSASSADIVASNDDCFVMFHNVLSVS